MKTTAQTLIVILFPLVLAVTWLRILLTPAFIQLEYNRPGFPDDPYGFTREERLHWAEASRLYMLSNEGGDYFRQFTLKDGSPLYNEREISHMVDVRNLVSAAFLLWDIGGSIFLAACLYLLWKERPALKNALSTASTVALCILLAVLTTLGLAWNWTFVTFHRLFFSGDTWMFPYSDSLIRLFPVEFWQDVAVTAVAGMLVTCLVIILATTGLPAWIRRRGNAAHA